MSQSDNRHSEAQIRLTSILDDMATGRIPAVQTLKSITARIFPGKPEKSDQVMSLISDSVQSGKLERLARQAGGEFKPASEIRDIGMRPEKMDIAFRVPAPESEPA